MGEMITLTASDGHELAAYRAAPAGAAKAGLVVIQEIFGVNSHMRDVCDRYAAEGYLAIAPAIYDRVERGVELGYTPDDMTAGREFRAGCDLDLVIKDVAAAAEAARAGGKVGIVGYCWGGSVVYVSCCRLPGHIDAGVGYYGGQIIPHLQEKPGAPVMLHFGELDKSIPLDVIEKIRSARPEVQIFVYEGADHGFNCDQRGQYHEATAKLALSRTLPFFEENLG
jgi:carboxymethylenebutenolidase